MVSGSLLCPGASAANLTQAPETSGRAEAEHNSSRNIGSAPVGAVVGTEHGCTDGIASVTAGGDLALGKGSSWEHNPGDGAVRITLTSVTAAPGSLIIAL